MDLFEIIKAFLDYGVLGILVAVLLYAIRKLGLVMLDDKKDTQKIGAALESFQLLLTSLEKQYNFMFVEYKAMLENERAHSSEISEKYMVQLAEYAKEAQGWRSDNLALLKELRTMLSLKGLDNGTI